MKNKRGTKTNVESEGIYGTGGQVWGAYNKGGAADGFSQYCQKDSGKKEGELFGNPQSCEEKERPQVRKQGCRFHGKGSGQRGDVSQTYLIS